MRMCTLVLLILAGGVGFVRAQDNPASVATPETAGSAPDQANAPAGDANAKDSMKDKAKRLADEAQKEVNKIAAKVDEDARAKTAAAGILQPIYSVAESLAFPAFHWLAFALMAAGVVSYALQLVLGKLVVLMRMGFSFKEIASDAVGLAISVVGLVLTTQAAAENSTFTQHPAAVISAAVAGLVVGIILYSWGQSQELDAAAGRTHAAVVAKKK